mgnify:CR=1 FL=1
MNFTIYLSSLLSFINIPEDVIEGLICAFFEITKGIKISANKLNPPIDVSNTKTKNDNSIYKW